MKFRSFRVVCAALSGAACLCGCDRGGAGTKRPAGQEKGPPKAVQFARAELRAVERAIPVTGTLAAQEQSTLSSKVAGRLQNVTVDIGSVVKKGDVIAQIEPRDYELRLQQAAAALAQTRAELGLPLAGDDDRVELELVSAVKQAKAVLDEATRNRDRTLNLSQSGIASDSELDSVKSAYTVSLSLYETAQDEARTKTAALAQRRAEDQIARKQLADTSLTSPYQGAIQDRRAGLGEYVAAGTPIVTLVQTDPLRLRLEVPEREAMTVRMGQAVRLRVEGDTNIYSGKIARLAPAITEENRMLLAEADVPNPGGLRAGLFARAEIIVNEHDPSLVLPTNALSVFAGIEKVVTVKDGMALERVVMTGRRGPDWVEIISGLSAGEAVVLEPAGIRSGQSVTGNGEVLPGTVSDSGRSSQTNRYSSAFSSAKPPIFARALENQDEDDEGAEGELVQKLAEICIRRPFFATMIVMTLVVVGVAGYLKLDVDRFPSVDLPTVRVTTRLPGASPAEMESSVGQPLEEAVNTIEGIKELRSVNGSGSTFLAVTFELDRDIDVAAQDVRDRVATVVRDLPRDVDPPTVAKFDNDQSPILTLAVTGGRSRRELTEIADKIIKKQIERSAGVGLVDVLGGLERAINVWVDADRLAAYQIPITAVRDAVGRQNANTPGGNVTTDLREQSLRTMGQITDPKAFNDLVIATRNGSPIRVRDIGWAEDGTKEQRTVSRLNGEPTVSLEVMRQSGANTVAVIEGVKQKLLELGTQLPSDVKLEVIRDQSRYIYEALHEIQLHLILGSILACLVVLLFMRNWRATVIAAVAIPTSVIASFGAMKALGFTLNSVTMLALVLMVGIVIDDAIVVLENIFRFIEEKKMRAFEAAKAATAEIGLAVMATTFSLVVIFVPVSFMSSIWGWFLYQFGITSAVAVLVSLLVSFTLTPMMSARLLTATRNGRRKEGADGAKEAPRSRSGFYAWIDHSYTKALGLSMRHRWLVAGLALLVMASSVPLYKLVRQEYLPTNVDEGEFDVNVTAREGTGLGSMNLVMQRVEDELRRVPGVQMVLSSVGGGGGFGGVNSARFYVRLEPHEKRTFGWGRLLQWPPWQAFQGNYSQRDVQQVIRRRLSSIPDVRIAVRNPQSFMGGGPNFDIDFALLGPDLDSLFGYAERLREKSAELGLLDADTSLKLDKPELRVEIDRERAANLGVDTEDIATALRVMVGGDTRVTRFRDETMNEDYDVQVRLKEGDRNSAETIARLFVPRQSGGLARLDNLVKLVSTKTPSRIDRLDRQRVVSLRASVDKDKGYAQADRIAALRAEVEKMNLPTGYSARVTGRARELETTFNEFLWAFLLSVILMYIILASQFESLVHPFTILLSLPLSVPFAFISLLAANQTINLYSALGLLVLFGVVKKNAILQIDHMNGLRRGGMERLPAIMQANRERLRPILMTTLTLIAGMLPLALGTGPGAEERRAVAVVVIGGQTLCLLLTLVVTPVAYSFLDDVGQKLRWRHWRIEPEAITPAIPIEQQGK